MTNKLTFRGNKEHLQLPKTAFLSSDRFSAASVLKSYDWAAEMVKQKRCVISGFHSKMEKDVFEILLRGKQPIIWVLARGMFKRPKTRLKELVESGQLLIISQFDESITERTREQATIRNKFVIDNADEIVIAHIVKGGMLDSLNIRNDIPVRVLDRY